MRVFVQDDNGKMMATYANGMTFTAPGVSEDFLGYALFKMMLGYTQVVPSMAIGDDIRYPLDPVRDVEGGTP